MSVQFLILLLPVLPWCQGACPIRPLNITIDEIYRKAPTYVTLVPSFVEALDLDTSVLDNVCLTYFPTADTSGFILNYLSQVFRNGTNLVISFLVNPLAPGQVYYLSFDLRYTNTLFATNGGTDNIYQLIEGQPTGFVESHTTVYRQYPSGYQQILNQFGFDSRQYRVLPMNLPPQCVTTCCQSNNCPTNNYPTNNCQG